MKQCWPRKLGHAVEFAAVVEVPACRFEASTLHPRPRSLQRITYAHTEMSFDLIVSAGMPSCSHFPVQPGLWLSLQHLYQCSKLKASQELYLSPRPRARN